MSTYIVSNRINSIHSPTTIEMPATQITIPHSFSAAVAGIANEARCAAVRELATKYGFDPEEALAFLGQSELKLVQKRGPAAKKTKEKEAKPKTKRGPTGYLLFSSRSRAEVQAELSLELDEGVKLKPQEVVKELAARWGALEEEERLVWKERAAEVWVDVSLEAEE